METLTLKREKFLARPIWNLLTWLRAIPVLLLALRLKLFKALFTHGLILRFIVFQLVQSVSF
ncbi:hypothetical protein ABF87_10570 [Nitrosomonas sp. JL21]|nr:hypothetical protein [Nitrosomonas sp. JL21]